MHERNKSALIPAQDAIKDFIAQKLEEFANRASNEIDPLEERESPVPKPKPINPLVFSLNKNLAKIKELKAN